MTPVGHDAPAAGPQTPVLLVVGGDPADVTTTAAALEHRFAPDYRVCTADSAAAAHADLARLARAGEQVALVAADLHLPDGDGVDLLGQAAALHRGLARVLLFDMGIHYTRIPFTELSLLQRASALGQIDAWMVKGWVNPEEWLYPQVQEALSAWPRPPRRSPVVYGVVGERWDPRCHDLGDCLTVNGVPFVFPPRDSDI